MAANKKPHRFDTVAHGVVQLGQSGRLRYSRLAGLLTSEGRAEFERDRAKAAHCPEHGELADPAVLLLRESPFASFYEGMFASLDKASARQ